MRDLTNKEQLQSKLRKLGLNITLEKTLQGGFVSQVYQAILNNQPVVVKHSEDQDLDSDPRLFISKNQHLVDANFLTYLENSSVRVPKVLYDFPKIATTIMEDLRASGFELMSELILEGVDFSSCAQDLGQKFAKLAQILKTAPLKTSYTTEQSWLLRAAELGQAYPQDKSRYQNLKVEFFAGTGITWTDGHPKNIFVNKKGEVAFIDFGLSCFGDQRYMLPNFFGQYLTFTLAGYLDIEQSISFMMETIDSYQHNEPLDEQIFIQYLGMEVLHRIYGASLQGIKTWQQKCRIQQFGLRIFDEEIKTLADLYDLLLSMKAKSIKLTYDFQDFRLITD
jgi:tRNA A-37 threonylcarbamoyl transferase component Bud32